MMTQLQAEVLSLLDFTDNAANKVKLMIEEEGNPELKLRIYVSGGGCGGMTYGMTYAENIGPMDKVLEGSGFKLLIDPVAMAYLKGCDIDFTDNGMSKSFVFNNVFKSVGGTGGCAGCGGGGCGA